MSALQTLSVVWTVVPVEAPLPKRHCGRCGVDRAFVSSGRFRVNGNGRKLDVWLIYRCVHCELTWNHTIHTRVAPESLGPRLDAYYNNDPELAFALAFSAPGPWEPVPFAVEGPLFAVGEVSLELPIPFPVRLERLLAQKLGLSRSAVSALVSRGELELEDPRALRRDARDGQRLVFRAG